MELMFNDKLNYFKQKGKSTFIHSSIHSLTSTLIVNIGPYPNDNQQAGKSFSVREEFWQCMLTYELWDSHLRISMWYILSQTAIQV